MNIGQAAKASGVSAKMIRYYEEIGLLPAPGRSAAGYRLYGAADRERLRFIAKARAIGFTLREIGEILTLRDGGAEPCPHVGTLLDRKLAAVDAQLRRNWTANRGTFVMIAKESRWVKVPWKYEMDVAPSFWM